MSASRPDVTRFAPPEATPLGRDRAREIAANGESLCRLLQEAATTVATLWDENDRLQAGVDRQMSIVAEIRGMIGIAEARARTAEKLLRLIEVDCMTHAMSCPVSSIAGSCDCGIAELKARIVVAQANMPPASADE